MKKLFTLLAFMTCFLGAKAGELVTDYTIDYSKYSGFPFYVMGYVPEWIDGVMTDYGANYRYATQADLDGEGDAKWKDGETSEGTVLTNNGTEYQKVTGAGPYWHQYFIADGIPTEVGGSYIIKALVKASAACSINVNMQWNWSGGVVSNSVSIPASDDFVEVEWEYSGIDATSCALIAQPGTFDGTIEWKSLTVSHEKEEGVVQTWLQMLTDTGNPAEPEGDGKYVGDAEFGAWPAWALELTDGINANWRGDNAGKICAWALTMGRNYDDQAQAISSDSPRARPYPADIEAEAGNEKNHLFAVHVDQIAEIPSEPADAASISWSNQFWIQSPKTWKTGTKVRIKFRYKADHACNVGTQIHTEHPSIYLHWDAVGDIAFSTEWQEFSKELTLNDSQGNGASLAFNLCSDENNGRTPNVFYFDDLSWEVLKLDEGLFIAAADTRDGDPAYDVNAAAEFVPDTDPDAHEGDLVAIVGTAGKESTWVNEVMISTVRGDKSAFNGATISPIGTIKSGEWMNYQAKSQAKTKLPAAGVWMIQVAPETQEICFTKIEGEADLEPVEIVTNPTECVVHGAEREDLKDGIDNGVITVKEEADDPEGQTVGGEGHEGQPWDNQFWIAANRDLTSGEVTVLKFKYKASKAARTSTQAHKVGDDGKPCTYLNWQAIGDVNFTEDWQDFSYEFTVPEGDNGMRSIVFNMAEIKEACDYYIKDVQWYLKDADLEAEGKTMENLINGTGAENFWIKVNSGSPESAATGISTVAADKKASNVTYNLAGQRVSNDYKGIVVKNGKKVVNK